MSKKFDPLKSTAPVIVYIDYKSPYAFVAKDLTYALSDKLGIAFDWRPVTLDIPSYLGSAKLNKAGKVESSNRTKSQWSGVKYAYADARRYAKRQGYALRGTEKIWDTRLIHIAMLWVKQQDQNHCQGQNQDCLRAFTDRVYPPFWRRELDVEDIAVVTELLQSSGVPIGGFADYAATNGGELHDEMQQVIFDCGIFGVPTYVCTATGQWLFGREHLATIEWLVRTHHLKEPAAQVGPPPEAFFPATPLNQVDLANNT
jgi:2-hydroxychromene-2-carboxylate isomerase